MTKEEILGSLFALLERRCEEQLAEVRSMEESRDTNDKSTAGDKHEVGRAMAQNELDNLQAQLMRTQASLKELKSLNLDRQSDEVIQGSLVHTDAGLYFLSIGLGQVTIKDTPVFVISTASPIGKLLLGKQAGDFVEFNGKKISIAQVQ